MSIYFVGIDLAKNVFQLCGLTQGGKVVYEKRVHRQGLLKVVSQLPSCLIGVEACTGAFYWQREFEKLGHHVKVISPQYVKPFVKGQKNDSNDAQAIAIALMQPTMQFVPPKSCEQQDIQALHRGRQRIINHRTATVCQIRGLLLDRGITIGSALTRARRAIPLILEDATNGLSDRMRRVVAELYDLLVSLDARIAFFDKEIQSVFKQSEDCQRIAKIKGVGPKTATAIIAAIGDGKEFKNGRHFAAWLGLVPRQHSSGDRHVMMNITKRGDQHLRTLLVHGARAVVRTASNKQDTFNQWVNQLKERRGYNKATVAVANKNARIIWAVLRHGTEYRGITDQPF
ncbi:IS110 family RNA-guided transposase [Thiolapillus sp.]